MVVLVLLAVSILYPAGAPLPTLLLFLPFTEDNNKGRMTQKPIHNQGLDQEEIEMRFHFSEEQHGIRNMTGIHHPSSFKLSNVFGVCLFGCLDVWMFG